MKRFRKTMATILSFLMCFTLFSNVAYAQGDEPEIPDSSVETFYIDESDDEDLVDEVETPIEEEETEDENKTEYNNTVNFIENIESVISEEKTYLFENDYNDSESLLAEYIDYKIDMNQTPVFNASSFAGDKLTGVNKKIYDKAKAAISEVANGKRASTVVSFSSEELGCSGEYSASNLGLSELVSGSSITEEAKTALKNKTGLSDLDLGLIGNALRADCPFERYWMGLETSYSGFTISGSNSSGEIKIYYEGEMTYKISVSTDYATSEEFMVDTEKTSSVNSAISSINDILSAAKSKDDNGKIEYFRDQICLLNSYNDEAATLSPSDQIDKYGNPWQLIYVFDGDPSTKTVCEGYSKAFMYLCNKTFFSNSAINCYVVSGSIDGSGHMWNIMHWSDDKNYLVDVTNCDSLENNDLFMAVPNSGTYAAGYSFKSGENEYLYIYDDNTKSIYSEKELTFDAAVYNALTDIFVNYDGYLISRKSLPFTVIREGGSESCQFRLDSVVNSSNESILGESYSPAYGTNNVFNITFPTEGEYTVRFSAKDTDETEKTKTITVDVKMSPEPVAYKVEHYCENLYGNFSSWPDYTDYLKGEALSSITPDVKNLQGFSSPEKQTVVINEDGSTVVKYEYKRNSYNISWDLNGGTASNNYTTGSVKYGAYITGPNAVNPGYILTGWTESVPTYMPAYDLSFKAEWSTNIWLGGVEITKENAEDLTAAINEAAGSTVATGTASYDFTKNIIYLSDFSYTGAGYQYSSNRWAALFVDGRELNISVSGTNSIVQHKTSSSDNEWGLGLYDDNGSHVNITGSGKTIFKADAVDDSKMNTYGIRMYWAGDVRVSGVDLVAIGEPTKNVSRGLNFVEYGDLSLSNGATIECSGGTTAAYYNYNDEDGGNFEHATGYYFLTGTLFDGSDAELNTTLRENMYYMTDYKYFKLSLTDLFIGGIPIIDQNAGDIVSAVNSFYPESVTGTITYNKDKRILTLENVDLTNKNTAASSDEFHCGICYSGTEDLTINLIGENSIISSTSYGDYTAGIYCNSASLNLLGDGSISLKGGNVGSYIDSYGIMASKTVTIDGPTVEAVGGDVSRYNSVGVYGGVHLKKGKLTAKGGSAGSYSIYDGYTYGIDGNVIVDDGELNAYGGNARASSYAYSYGIEGSLTVNNGTVNLSAGETVSPYGSYSEGLYGDLILNKGKVNVYGGESKTKEGEEYEYNYSYGINGDAIVNDGILNVNTLNADYCAYGIDDELKVKGGTVNVNTGDSTYCIGVYKATIDGGIVKILTGNSTTSSTGVNNECRINGGTVTITPGNSKDTCRGTGYLYAEGGNTEISSGKGAKNSYGVSGLYTYSGNVKILAEDASENSYAVNGYTSFSGGRAELISKGTGSAAQVINYSYISISTSKSAIGTVSCNSDGSSPEEYDENNLSRYKYLKTAEAFGLMVGDKIVTSANCADLFGDGKVSFDPSNETLKLNNASLEASGNYAVIQVTEGYLEDLTVEVSGQNTLTYTGTTSEACGIFSYKNVNVKFDQGAELNVRSSETSEGSSYVGVRANGLTVDGKGKFNIYGRQYKDFNGSSIGLRVGTKLILSNDSVLNVYSGDFVNTDGNYHNNDLIAIWTYQGTDIEIGDGCELYAASGVYKSGYNSGRRIGMYYNTSGTITLKGSAKVRISAMCAEEESEYNNYGYGLFLYNPSYNDSSASFNILTDSWNGMFEIDGDNYVFYNTGYYYSSSKIKHDPDVIDIICYNDSSSICVSEEEFGSTYIYYKKMFVRPHQTYNVTINPGKGMSPATVYNEDCVSVDSQYYYPEDGYYFSDDFEEFSVNGIKVFRPSQYYIYVSGVPTADTTIVLPDATVKPAVTSVVSFDANGGSGTKTNETVNKGSAYTLPAGNTFGAPQGYTFDKWEVTVGTETAVNKNPGESITINADTKVKALWKAATGTAYKVEHYKQGLDGKYTASPEVENLKGTTGASVKPALKSYEGFVAPAAQTGTIKADGSLVIKYYYTRNSYQLKWNLDGGKASGTYTSGTVKYGESIKAPTLSKDGYTFKSWDATVPSTMPAKNLTFTAKWEKKEKTEEELVTDFVKRFYKEVLGRSDSAIEKDSEGINDWVTKLLTKEKTGAEVAKGFVNSKEFKNRNVKNEEFVRIMYVSFFGREPDEGGYKGWLDKLNAGTSREDVLAGFTNSQEFKNLCAKYNINPGKLETSQSQQNKPAQQPEQSAPPLQVDTSNVDQEKLDAWIERLYDKALGRKSDAEGKAYWKDVILNGEDAKGNQYDITSVISTGFLNSKEYKNKNTDNKQFVADCYAAFFNRDPRGTDDEVHYNDWVRQLDEGLITRKQMIEIGFGHSKEFKNLLESYNFKIIE